MEFHSILVVIVLHAAVFELVGCRGGKLHKLRRIFSDKTDRLNMIIALWRSGKYRSVEKGAQSDDMFQRLQLVFGIFSDSERGSQTDYLRRSGEKITGHFSVVMSHNI